MAQKAADARSPNFVRWRVDDGCRPRKPPTAPSPASLARPQTARCRRRHGGSARRARQRSEAEVGQAAPFFNIERHSPARFTVTNFSVAADDLLPLPLLVILPVLGLREATWSACRTIAKPVTQGPRQCCAHFPPQRLFWLASALPGPTHGEARGVSVLVRKPVWLTTWRPFNAAFGLQTKSAPAAIR